MKIKKLTAINSSHREKIIDKKLKIIRYLLDNNFTKLKIKREEFGAIG